MRLEQATHPARRSAYRHGSARCPAS
jgi:hypothetical protein